MRRALAVVLLAALVAPVHTSAAERAVTLVVSTPAGAGVDRIARLFAERLAPLLDRPVVVENRPGAAGRLATEHVAKATADGSVLLVTTGSSVIDLAFHPGMRPNAVDDLAAVSPLVIDQPVLVVPAASPITDLEALVARARAAPDGVSFAAVGPLSTMRVVGELFKQRTGTALLAVPYRGEADALRALLARDVDLGVISMSSAQPLLEAGTLRALGVASDRRSPQLPAVPTLAEAGIAGVGADIWYGLFAPAGTPVPVVAALAQAAAQIAAQPEYRRAIESGGLRAVSSTPGAFLASLRAELERYRDLAATSKLKLD